MLLVPNCLESTPKFLDLDYKARPDSDYLAKFHSNQLNELGDIAAEK